MKKLVITSIAALSIMIMVSIPVKAEYELDENGNLVKVEATTNVEPTTITISVKEAATVPVTAKGEETTKKAERVTLKKVTKLKKKTVYKYYKGVKSIDKNDNPVWGKIKYKYGIKLTWKRIKGVTGYEVYRYENAAKKWTKIKTIKKNKQNPSYTLTDMLKGENVRIKVRAYKKTKSGKVYGKYSKVLKFKTKQQYTKIYKNARYKKYISKFGSQDAFVYQNQLRKKEGAKALIWSDILYSICVQRTKDNESYAHEKFRATTRKVLMEKYGISEENARDFSAFCVSENLHYGSNSVKGGVYSWYTEKYDGHGNGSIDGKGHYRNMINKEKVYGAIAIPSNGVTVCGIYADLDTDSTTRKLEDGTYYTRDFSFMYK